MSGQDNALHRLSLEANKLRQEENWPEAIKKLSTVIQLASEQGALDLEVAAYINRGAAHRHNGDAKAAAADLSLILREPRYRQSPHFPMAVFHYGCGALSAGNLVQGNKQLHWFARNYKPPVYAVQLDKYFVYEADLELLLHDLDTALEQQPELPALRFARAMLYATQKNYYPALEDFRAAAADQTLAVPTEHAIKAMEKVSMRVSPKDRDLMLPGIEYAVMTFDREWDKLQVEYFDLEAQRSEDHSGEDYQALHRALLADAWIRPAQNDHKEGFVWYYQRPRSGT
jgi:hypothetical protein